MPVIGIDAEVSFALLTTGLSSFVEARLHRHGEDLLIWGMLINPVGKTFPKIWDAFQEELDVAKVNAAIAKQDKEYAEFMEGLGVES